MSYSKINSDKIENMHATVLCPSWYKLCQDLNYIKVYQYLVISLIRRSIFCKKKKQQKYKNNKNATKYIICDSS